MGAIAPIEFETKDGEVILVRPAEVEDAQKVFELMLDTMAEGISNVTEPDEFAQSRNQERGFILKHLDTPTYLVLVAELGGEIIGTLNFQNGARRRIVHRGTFTICVAKQWRELGAARALLTALLEWAEAHDVIEKIYTEVLETSDWEIDLCKKMGFQLEGRRTHSIKIGPGEYVDTLMMSRFVNR